MATDDHGQQQRLDGLRRLVAQRGAAPTPTSQQGTLSRRWQSRRPWRAVILTLLTLAVVAGGMGFLLTHRQPDLVKTPDPLIIQLPAGKFYCPQTPSWAPDALRVAVVISDGTCPEGGSPGHHSIAIYDTQTGTMTQRLDLDGALTKVGLPELSKGSGGLLTWSPDGERIAMTTLLPAGPTTANLGVLVFSLRGQDSRLLTSKVPYLLNQETINSAVWDMESGTVASTYSSLPLALTYQLTADGKLAPDKPVVMATTTPTLTGSPTGAVISRWQPGSLGYLPQDHDHPEIVAAWAYWSRITSWSGKYLIAGVPIGSLLGGKAPAWACAYSGNADLCAEPPLAMPDLAFAALAGKLRNATDMQVTNDSMGSISWRADGKVLAMVAQANNGSEVALYATETGQALKTIPIANMLGAMPLWAPKGNRLLTFDTRQGQIAIWGNKTLPA